MFELKQDAPLNALAGLNEAQLYAVELGSGPILVIAGAGSGKTRTLVHRVARLVEKGVNPSSILLLTFTRKAAEEMLSRARSLNPACAKVEGGTFHSLCHRLLRRYAAKAGLASNFTIIDRGDAEQLIRGVVEELKLKTKGDKLFPRMSTILDMISKSRNQELALSDILEEQAGHLAAYIGQVEQAAAGYKAAKRGQQLLDYDDLLYEAEALLKNNRDLRREVSQRWKYLMVDEYQDTNAVQARLVSLLCEEHKNVMVVGDDAQSIYRFRGARVQNIMEFPRRFPGTRLIKLEQNYRSTQPILDLTNHIIALARDKYEKHLFTEQTGGLRPRLLRPRDERGQSRLVLESIHSLLKEGAELGDIAVLFRASYDSYDLEIELTQEFIPFVKVGGFRFLESAHIKDVLAHLRVVVNPQDYISWQRVLMLLPGVGPKKASQIIAHMALAGSGSEYFARLESWPAAAAQPGFSDLLHLLLNLSRPGLLPQEAVEEALQYYEPLCRQMHEDYPKRLRDLGELPGLARAYDTLADLMADLVLEPPNARQEDMEGKRLTLTTVHSAKGLEWPHVLVLWANEGRFPPGPALGDPEALEEERRLMYVACTRAAKTLTLLAPKEQYSRGQGLLYMDVSRFLEDMPESLLDQEQAQPVFKVPVMAAQPQPRRPGSLTQDRPFAVGAQVSHAKFGQGKVMGYQGEQKIMVHFQGWGLKILLLHLANLRQV